MARQDNALLPPSSELQLLTDDKAKAIIGLADNESRRSNVYAMTGMFCGTVSFLGCLASYVYLVVQHHDRAAGVILGATVLAIVGRMIRGQ